MAGRIEKHPDRHPTLSRALQHELLSALRLPSSTDHPSSGHAHEQLKRFHDNPSSSPPAKRPCVEAVADTPLACPVPHSYASFLRDFVDHVEPSTETGLHPSLVAVTEWLSTLDTLQDSSTRARDKHCRSDSCISGAVTKETHISRQRHLSKSLPPMSDCPKTGVAYGYAPAVPTHPSRAMLPPPFPYRLPSARRSLSATRSSARPLVETSKYRLVNLNLNHMHLRHRQEPMPEHVAGLVEMVGRGRDSPGPSLEEVAADRDLAALQEDGTPESGLEQYFERTLFTYPGASDNLQRTDRLSFFPDTVPYEPSNTYPVSRPMPDMALPLYTALPLNLVFSACILSYVFVFNLTPACTSCETSHS